MGSSAAKSGTSQARTNDIASSEDTRGTRIVMPVLYAVKQVNVASRSSAMTASAPTRPVSASPVRPRIRAVFVDANATLGAVADELLQLDTVDFTVNREPDIRP